jgi:hypothetical protein
LTDPNLVVEPESVNTDWYFLIAGVGLLIIGIAVVCCIYCCSSKSQLEKKLIVELAEKKEHKIPENSEEGDTARPLENSNSKDKNDKILDSSVYSSTNKSTTKLKKSQRSKKSRSSKA